MFKRQIGHDPIVVSSIFTKLRLFFRQPVVNALNRHVNVRRSFLFERFERSNDPKNTKATKTCENDNNWADIEYLWTCGSNTGLNFQIEISKIDGGIADMPIVFRDYLFNNMESFFGNILSWWATNWAIEILSIFSMCLQLCVHQFSPIFTLMGTKILQTNICHVRNWLFSHIGISCSSDRGSFLALSVAVHARPVWTLGASLGPGRGLCHVLWGFKSAQTGEWPRDPFPTTSSIAGAMPNPCNGCFIDVNYDRFCNAAWRELTAHNTHETTRTKVLWLDIAPGIHHTSCSGG